AAVFFDARAGAALPFFLLIVSPLRLRPLTQNAARVGASQSRIPLPPLAAKCRRRSRAEWHQARRQCVLRARGRRPLSTAPARRAGPASPPPRDSFSPRHRRRPCPDRRPG